MLRDTLLTLVDFNSWANRRILDHAARLSDDDYASATGGTVRGLRATLVHTLDGEWSWRLKIAQSPAREWESFEFTPAQLPTLAALRERWEPELDAFRALVASFSDEELAATLDLGGPDCAPRWYFVMHVLHHGQQNRADAATILTALGHSPGDMDFLNFADWQREQAQPPGG